MANLIRKQKISKDLRNAVLDNDNHRCRCCGCPDSDNLEIDHIKSEIHGGKTELDNLQALCGYCNKKIDRLEREFEIQPMIKAGTTWGNIQYEMKSARYDLRQWAEAEKIKVSEKILADAIEWKKSGLRNQAILKRLQKITTKGIAENIFKKVSNI